MNNKVLVEVVVPSIEKRYDVYIPINRKIGNVIELLSKMIEDLSNGEFKATGTNTLFNEDNGESYEMDVLVLNTNIRNGSKIILM